VTSSPRPSAVSPAPTHGLTPGCRPRLGEGDRSAVTLAAGIFQAAGRVARNHRNCQTRPG
jgi:hypothetical protein